MPAWQTGQYMGVKLITMCPQNAEISLPSIQGMYLLFNAETGEPLAQIDAPTLTNLRTAAASALAAKLLANSDVSNFLMVGTGSLAPYLIRAHAAIRKYSNLRIWGRNLPKAKRVASALRGRVNLEVVENLQDAVEDADVVSVATLSRNPLILGDWLRPGMHLDLVGSYKPDMREADDKAITRSSIYIDTGHAVKETGDLMIPMANGIISESDIKGTLVDLCCQTATPRESAADITLFKSVGHASEDLIAGIMAYEQYGSIF